MSSALNLPAFGPDYEALDQRLLAGEIKFTPGLASRYVEHLPTHPLYARMEGVKRFSMLHVDTLMLLRAFALASRGHSLEIGAYIGGSSVAVALGLPTDRRQVVIEVGGEFSAQPYLPSDDILADWRRNLTAEGLIDRPILLEGWSVDPTIISRAREELSEGVGLLFIDADGEVERDFTEFRDLLQPGCLLVIDDYHFPNREITDPKEASVQTFVHAREADGSFERLGVFQWGTWFGRWRG